METSSFKAFGKAFFKLTVNLFFAYCFYFGGYFRWNDFKAGDGTLISGGDILSIVFLLMDSTSILGINFNLMPAIGSAKIAGQMAFDIIKHVPGIQSNESGSQIVERNEFKGKIEFDNVCFNYPSNPDLKVLNNFTCTIEPGQMIGLIGPSGSGKSTII